MGGDIHSRKDDHLEIAVSGRGAFSGITTLLEEVELVHGALPELSLDEIDLSTELFGKTLAAPLLIGAMTGGTDRGGGVNEDLAEVAAELHIGLCLGSQRVMVEHPDSLSGFDLRRRFDRVLLIGNIGVVQARALGADVVASLAEAVGADAMALHLNPAQELCQKSGDRDFRGCLDIIEELSGSSKIDLLVKETGCGISRQTGEALVSRGVRHIEVGGAGGTSWVRVESEREPTRRWLGEILADWGIPTAASLLLLDDLPITRIAGGGIRGPMDLARALALGAKACSVAQPVLAAHRAGGVDAVIEYLGELIDGLAAICLLTGCRRASDLARAPRVIGPRLESWRAAAHRPAATERR